VAIVVIAFFFLFLGRIMVVKLFAAGLLSLSNNLKAARPHLGPVVVYGHADHIGRVNFHFDHFLTEALSIVETSNVKPRRASLVRIIVYFRARHLANRSRLVVECLGMDILKILGHTAISDEASVLSQRMAVVLKELVEHGPGVVRRILL